jgi:anti-anti-sigma factor
VTTVLTPSDTFTVVLRGAYDLGNRDRLREQLDGACLHGWATVTVDLAAVTFIDAGAVGLIVRAWNRQRGDGNDLRVVNAQGIVARVFQLCKLDGLLTIDLA